MKIKVIEKYRKGTHLRFFNTSDQYLKIMETRCIFFYVKIHRYSEIDIRMDRIKQKNLENKWRFESTRSRVVSSFLNLKNEPIPLAVLLGSGSDPGTRSLDPFILNRTLRRAINIVVSYFATKNIHIRVINTYVRGLEGLSCSSTNGVLYIVSRCYTLGRCTRVLISILILFPIFRPHWSNRSDLYGIIEDKG